MKGILEDLYFNKGGQGMGVKKKCILDKAEESHIPKGDSTKVKDSVSNLKKHIKVDFTKASIDNLIFKMHYRATFIFLILATFLVCFREFIGEHIRCIVDKGVPEDVINTFCFFTSTFTVVHHFNESMLEKGYIPHPGVGPSIDEDPVKRHAYYQWVPFMLFSQAILFYLPHALWKNKEGGRMQALIDGLHLAAVAFADQDIKVNGIVVPSKDTIKRKMKTIKSDFISRLHATRTWSVWLIICECLNFLNVILQVYLTNKFLQGDFLDLGYRVAQHDDWSRKMDPLDTVFPKVTKCQFQKYGPSGSIQKHDALCVMALNVINEKIYTFLWFWYLFLIIITALGLIWRLISFILHSRSAKFSAYVFGTINPGKLSIDNMISVTRECYYADWLFLYYLGRNLNGFVFRNLFIDLAEEFDRTRIDRKKMMRAMFSTFKDTPYSNEDSVYNTYSPSYSGSPHEDGSHKLLSQVDFQLEPVYENQKIK